MVLAVSVNEGVQYRLADFSWSGNTLIANSDLSKCITLKQGEPVNSAKLNHDLAQAVVRTCADLGTTPENGSHHDDYQKVDNILDGCEQALRQSFESEAVRSADQHAQAVLNLVCNWSINSARDVAWDTALGLWAARGVAPVEDLIMSSVARTVAMASRCLLVTF